MFRHQITERFIIKPISIICTSIDTATSLAYNTLRQKQAENFAARDFDC